MSHFIETIRIENGTVPMLNHHQQRMNHTLSHLGERGPFLIKSLLRIPKEAGKGIFKCRLIYDKDGILDIQFHPYTIRHIETFSMVDIGSHSYPYKFEDRAWINDLVNRSKADEIIMCQKDRITDASYANLAFFNGKFWVTPKKPLLHGTRRNLLLQKNILEEIDLTLHDLHNYSHFKCINAMMSWEESPIYKVEQIQ
ncbi:aminotransferase class IV [uncultured Muriicola sp.]|uniref:aminotransferase class IV n=1 Tax=uncultured Muriicola sp. TaxID=1583102 RepID=UPI0026275803|nr:aminotransferase class IV [uncultured Muriicola sp.]